MNGRQGSVGGGQTLLDRGERGRIVDQVGQAGGDCLHVGVELAEIGGVEAADRKAGRGIEDGADLRQRGVGTGGGGERGRVIGTGRQRLEAGIVGARAARIGGTGKRVGKRGVAVDLVEDRGLRGVDQLLIRRRSGAVADRAGGQVDQRLQLTLHLLQHGRIRARQSKRGAADGNRARVGEHGVDVVEHGMDVGRVHAGIGNLIIAVGGGVPQSAIKQTSRIVEYGTRLREIGRGRERIVAYGCYSH